MMFIGGISQIVASAELDEMHQYGGRLTWYMQNMLTDRHSEANSRIRDIAPPHPQIIPRDPFTWCIVRCLPLLPYGFLPPDFLVRYERIYNFGDPDRISTLTLRWGRLAVLQNDDMVRVSLEGTRRLNTAFVQLATRLKSAYEAARELMQEGLRNIDAILEQTIDDCGPNLTVEPELVEEEARIEEEGRRIKAGIRDIWQNELRQSEVRYANISAEWARLLRLMSFRMADKVVCKELLKTAQHLRAAELLYKEEIPCFMRMWEKLVEYRLLDAFQSKVIKQPKLSLLSIYERTLQFNALQQEVFALAREADCIF